MSERSELRVVQPLELTKIGDRSVSARGWRIPLVRQHLEEHGLSEWCTVECLARTMFQRNTASNREEVRSRVSKAFTTLLDRDGLFMVIDYDKSRSGHGKILAVKLYNATDESEKQAAAEQLDRMARRKELVGERLDRAKALLETT